MSLTVDGNYFADLDGFGMPTPRRRIDVLRPVPVRVRDRVRHYMGTLTIQSIDCHHNGGNCIGGGGSMSISIDDLDCWNNGNAYSMTPEFLYVACIKRAAVYSTPGNTTVHPTPTSTTTLGRCLVRLLQARLLRHRGQPLRPQRPGGSPVGDVGRLDVE